MKNVTNGRISVICACWACGGSGFHVKSAAPLRFKPCWMCYGNLGRVAALASHGGQHD